MNKIKNFIIYNSCVDKEPKHALNDTAQYNNISIFNNIVNDSISYKILDDKTNQQNYEKRLKEKFSNVGNDIANEIYNLIEDDKNINKNNIPDKLKSILKKINKDNILSVLDKYKNNTIKHNSLIKSVITNVNIDTKTKELFLKKIKDICVENAKSYNIPTQDMSILFDKELKLQLAKEFPKGDLLETFIIKLEKREGITSKELEKPNGKIDKPFQQGHTGNCWLISALDALSGSKKGLQILNNMISIDKNGNATVKLNGVQKSYKITAEELASNTQFSTGDKDIRLIEIAFDKYFQDNHNLNNAFDLNGNFCNTAYKIITGKESECIVVNDKQSWKNILNKIQNTPNSIATVASCRNEDLTIVTEDNKTQEVLEFTFQKEHAYTIKSINEYSVILTDPNNNKNEYVIPKEPFMEFFTQIEPLFL